MLYKTSDGQVPLAVTMALLYLCIGLLIQGSFIFCEDKDKVNTASIQDIHNEALPQDSEKIKPLEMDPTVKDDFFKTFFGGNFYPSPSTSMMNQVTNSQKSPEEQLKDIKEVANTICTMMQSEMANLMSFALDCVKHGDDKNELREKRSAESPIDSTKFLMRLLNHIKNNNEYQNIAIEKMMSAQQIADKFGIEFTPDTEVLTDLATAANKQTEDLADILKDACEPKNKTVEVSFVSLQEDGKTTVENVNNDDTYYVYSIQKPEQDTLIGQQNAVPVQQYQPEQINKSPANHPTHQYPHHHHIETQMVAPPVHQHHHHRPQQNYAMPPVSPRPNFYELPMSYTPMPEYYPQFCAEFEPIPAAIISVEEIADSEPELVGEELEETVTSKILIDHEEPGTATVNHVMTYTVSEKAHFKAPQKEQLPQQMQYAFFLM